MSFSNGDQNGTALRAVAKTIGTPVNGTIGADFGQTLTGANGGNKDVDFVSYTSSSAGLLDIVAQSNSSGFTPAISLWEYTSGSQTITKVADTENSTNEEIISPIAAGASFFVAVTGQGNENFNWAAVGSGTGGQTGDYTLTTTLRPTSDTSTLTDNVITDTPQTLVSGQMISGNIGMDGNFVVGPTDVDMYKYVATSDATVDVKTFTGAENDANTVLHFFDSSGNQLASNDNATPTTTASEVTASVQAGQTYYIGVNGSGPNALKYNPLTGAGGGVGSTGNYSMSVVATPKVAGAPTLTIANAAAITEPAMAGGTANAIFTVTLSSAASSDITVNYTTADGTAIAGTDYTTTSGTLTIPAGSTTGTISVPVINNPSVSSGTKTFSVVLSGASGATLGTAQGSETITDVAPIAGPVVSIANAPAVTEPLVPGATVNAVFTVSLTQAAGTDVTVNYATSDGTAVAGTDYAATSGTLTIPAGSTSGTIGVPVLNNAAAAAGTKTFSITLSAPSGAGLGASTATETVTDVVPTIKTFGGKVKEIYTDSAGSLVTLTLKGGGTGSAYFIGAESQSGRGATGGHVQRVQLHGQDRRHYLQRRDDYRLARPVHGQKCLPHRQFHRRFDQEPANRGHLRRNRQPLVHQHAQGDWQLLRHAHRLIAGNGADRRNGRRHWTISGSIHSLKVGASPTPISTSPAAAWCCRRSWSLDWSAIPRFIPPATWAN